MRKWILKAVIQKIISYLPGKHRVNYLFQKYVTRGVRLSDYYFEDRLIHLRQHLAFFEKYKGDPQGARLLELGAGWYPVIPVGFFLAGADLVYTVDISRLMDKQNLLTTLRCYERYHREGRLNNLPFRPERFAELHTILETAAGKPLEELLAALHLQYLVVDARRLPLHAAAVDMVCSNNTFEHIHPPVLRDLLPEFRRILRPDGLMSHFIDMSDHFAHLDPGITIYHFLRFSGNAWRRIDNSIQPQNRWRITHYRRLYRELGLPITEELPRPGDLAALRTVPLAPPFNALPEEEVAVSHCYVVSVLGV